MEVRASEEGDPRFHFLGVAFGGELVRRFLPSAMDAELEEILALRYQPGGIDGEDFLGERRVALRAVNELPA